MFTESLIFNSLFNEKRENFQNQSAFTLRNFILSFLNIALAIIAGFLAWNCSKHEKTILQILYTILAVIFSGIYLLFYLIYRVLLNNPCN